MTADNADPKDSSNGAPSSEEPATKASGPPEESGDPKDSPGAEASSTAAADAEQSEGISEDPPSSEAPEATAPQAEPEETPKEEAPSEEPVQEESPKEGGRSEKDPVTDPIKELVLVKLAQQLASEIPPDSLSDEARQDLQWRFATKLTSLLEGPAKASLTEWVGGAQQVQATLCEELNQASSDKIFSWSEQGLTVEDAQLEELDDGEEIVDLEEAPLPSDPEPLVTLEAVPQVKIKAKLVEAPAPEAPTPETPVSEAIAAPRKVLKAKLVRRLSDPVPQKPAATPPAPSKAPPQKRVKARPVARASSAAADQGADKNQFLETSNIRWGLVLGALLLVGGSIPLALKLLQSENDVLKFVTFVLTTLGLLGLAEACVRWLKIKLTGQSLGGAYLFLVPLNLLAADALSISLPISGVLGIVLSLGMLRAIPLLELRSLPLVVGGAMLSLAQLGPGSFQPEDAFLWTLPIALIFALSLALEGQRIRRGEGDESLGGFFLSLAIPSFPYLLLIGRGLASNPESTLIALPTFFAGFGLMQCGQAFIHRFPEDRRQVLGSGLLIFGEILTLIGLFSSFKNPNAMLLMGVVGLASALLSYRREPRGRFLGAALISGTLAASAGIALSQGWPDLLHGGRLWFLYHSPIAWAYGLISLVLSKRKAEQATLLHILAAMLTLAFASQLEEPGSFLCISGLIFGATVVISRQEHYSFASAAFVGLGSLALVYEYDHRKLQELCVAAASLALAFRVLMIPALRFKATEGLYKGFTTFSAIFGLWALCASPLNGPGSMLCLSSAILTASAFVGLCQHRNAFDAMFITATLALFALSIPAYEGNAIRAFLHPHAGLTLGITTSILSILACGLARWREDLKTSLTLPMSGAANLIALFSVCLQMVLDIQSNRGPGAELHYAPAAAVLSALTMLALSVQVRSKILSFLGGGQVIAAFALASTILDLHDTPAFPLYALALAFFFAEAPRILARLGVSEDDLEPHRVSWPILAFLATLPVDLAFLITVLEQLRGYELSFENLTVALSLGGLTLLFGLRTQESKKGFWGVFASLHLFLTVAAFLFTLPLDLHPRLAFLAAVLPSMVLGLSFLPQADEESDSWKAVLQVSLRQVSTFLGAAFLPIAFLIFVGGQSPTSINTGAALGCLALGSYFSRLTLSGKVYNFYCAYSAYSLCLAFAFVALAPNRPAALALGLASIGALVQALSLTFQKSAEQLLEELSKPVDISLLVALPISIILILSAPLHTVTPVTLILLGVAGIAGRRAPLIALGLLAASLAAFRGVALVYDGQGNDAEEVLGLSFISVTLSYLMALAARMLRGRDENWELRGKILGAGALIHAFLATLTIFGLSFFILDGQPGPGAVGFGGGLFMIVALFAYWIYEAYQRDSELLVYFGQITLALIFLFVRACQPELFQTGLFKRFWPLIIVFISFLSVFLSSALDRLEKDIFGRATRRAGLALPIFALLGTHFFVNVGVSALTFFMAAGLYAWVSVQRKSLMLSVTASWLFCVGLIDFIVYGQVSFDFYPYLFAMPVSLTFFATSVLVRDKYPKEAKLLKDIGALTLFAVLAWSLFADEQGRVLESVLLAVLSILGLIVGIRLKERSLMILGTLFVLLDLITNIYWIGKEQAWVWWVSVMALGVAVILLFSYFERLQALLDKNDDPPSPAPVAEEETQEG